MRRVAVDAMGGDAAPAAMCAGVALAVADGISCVLVGDPARVVTPPGVALVAAYDVVAMDDPAAGVRSRDDASIRRALDLVSAGEADAVVTCGPTGAALVAAVVGWGASPGVDRPGLAAVLPRLDGGSLVWMDAGANVDTRPEHLLGFVELGVALARALGVVDPRVCVGSNAAERNKGDARVRALLDARPDLSPCEPHEALAGACDVLVFDGFVGNVALKAMEAAAELTLAAVAAEGGSEALVAASRRRIDWRARGGALLVGVPGTLVVGHGRSDAEAVRQAIGLARKVADGRRPPSVVP